MRWAPDVAGNDNPGVIAPPPLIALGTLLAGLLLDWLVPTSLLRLLLSFQHRIALGLIVAAAGAILAIIGERTFRWVGTNVPPWKPSLNLATIGIYRFLRNPMYVGLGFLTAGLGISFGSDWTLVLLIPAAIVMHYGVVLREERYLLDKFGDAYRSYKASVPRYGWPL
jgi:protein-S-isoprenylcysteine O-methyltransferase Ste14